jgi:hypothetical protein
MAIFGVLELEDVVQVGDKTRLSGVKSFVSKDEAAITLVRIKPESTGSFVTVSGVSLTYKDWYLDWSYATSGTKTVTIEITAGSVQTFTRNIEVVSEADDKLLSKDADLIAYEPDILKWVPSGRSSFLNLHRASQRLILDWLDSIRIWRNDGTKLTKDDISVTDDLKQLSAFLTLEMIFFGLSNKVDDTFLQKAKLYYSRAEGVKNRGRIQADFNGDGDLDSGENEDMKSFKLVRG